MKKIQGDGFEVEVIRSQRRKTMALSVRNGTVSVRMPARLAQHHAELFVDQKKHWIKQKLAQHPPVPRRELLSGDNLPFMGHDLSLLVESGHKRNRIERHGDTLIIQTRDRAPTQETRRQHIQRWYRQQATELLPARCQALARWADLQPAAIQVKSYKARWGSCTIKGDIQLNWKLIMAPSSIIDYVIIHELCHLKQHNHSPAFWQLVAQFDPNFTTHRAWLKNNGAGLAL